MELKFDNAIFSAGTKCIKTRIKYVVENLNESKTIICGYTTRKKDNAPIPVRRKLDGIVVLGNGIVCPTFQKHLNEWDLYEIHVKVTKHKRNLIKRNLIMGTALMSKRVVPMKKVGTSLKESVEEYNSRYLEAIKDNPIWLEDYYRYMILAYMEF